MHLRCHNKIALKLIASFQTVIGAVLNIHKIQYDSRSQSHIHNAMVLNQLRH